MNQQERDKKKKAAERCSNLVQCILLLLNFGREELVR